ncbi:MAG: hypothetical protein Q8Q89_01970 [bacterium]|nr:hypothetical protein [bacterium]
MDEQQFTKPVLDKFRQWHFWWLVVFSMFLIMTYVFYLPTMFLNQSMAPHDAPMMGMPVDESQPHSHDPSGSSIPNAPVTTSSATPIDESQPHGHDDSGNSMPAVSPAGTGSEHMMENGTTIMSGFEVYQEEGNLKEGLVVNLNVNPAPFNSGESLKLDFFVNQKPGNIQVPFNQLEISHEKLIHVIGMRSDMNEFFHIHPQPSPDNDSVFTINHVFKKPGLYKIWSDIKKGGVTYTFGHTPINITGSDQSEEKPFDKTQGKQVSFERNAIAGNYQVSLVADGTVVKNRETNLSFDIHTLTGQEIEVEPYLGADMHLAIIKDDWSHFIHAHPASGEDHEHSQIPGFVNIALANGGDNHGAASTPSMSENDEVITFTATFPETGQYKAFVQFRPKGINLPKDEALVAEFWIEVKDKTPFPISQWWGLLLVSIPLIAGLSWVVKKYLVVKPEDVKIKK